MTYGEIAFFVIFGIPATIFIYGLLFIFIERIYKGEL